MDTASGLGVREKSFAQSAFRDFYRTSLVAPPATYAREFGFGFEKKIDFRHKSFSTADELKEFVLRESPLFMSYSTAYYRHPGAQPMPNKEFLGADLVFDLDADTSHEGHNPVFCHECFNRVRLDTISLIDDFLVHDFGIPPTDLSVNFSGQKGFHIHIRSESVRNLTAEARRQLINYITAADLDLEKILFKQKRASDSGNAVSVLRGPDGESRGWARKLYRAATGLVERGDAGEMRAIGLSKPQAGKLIDNKAVVLAKLREGNWDYLRGMEKAWSTLLSSTLKLRSVAVDRNVTYDLARLIRLPDSLHGDTGFVAKTMALPELAIFDPTRDAIAFQAHKPQAVAAHADVSFIFAGEEIQLKAGARKTLPYAAAMLAVCKKKAALA